MHLVVTQRQASTHTLWVSLRPRPVRICLVFYLSKVCVCVGMSCLVSNSIELLASLFL